VDNKEPGARPEPEARPEEKSLVQLLTELFDLVNRYVRDQVRTTLRRSVILPLQRLGLNLAFTIVAAMMAAISVIFLAVGFFLYLALAVGYPLAYLIIGFFYLLIAAILVAIRVRTVQ